MQWSHTDKIHDLERLTGDPLRLEHFKVVRKLSAGTSLRWNHTHNLPSGMSISLVLIRAHD
jgi:hypothetical protein